MSSHLNPLTGLVICGGMSSRMGTEKHSLNYHGVPQYRFVSEMMNGLVKDTFLSINPNQDPGIFSDSKGFIDAAEFEGYGPIGGVLTAFKKLPGASLLVAGCDYPFLQKTDLDNLIEGRDHAYDAICYAVEGIDEPLITIYENSCANLLSKYFKEGNTSLRIFLGMVKTKKLKPSDANRLRSVDTVEGYERAKQQLSDPNSNSAF